MKDHERTRAQRMAHIAELEHALGKPPTVPRCDWCGEALHLDVHAACPTTIERP